MRALILFFAIPLLSQVPSRNAIGFKAVDAGVTLAGAASETLTVSQPSGPKRRVLLYRAVAQCNANTFTVTQAQNGTDPTSTTLAWVSLDPQQPSVSALAKAWSASNVGTGTAIEIPLFGAAGVPMVIDLSPLSLPQNSPNVNYSITIKNTGSGSDTCSLSVQDWEQ